MLGPFRPTLVDLGGLLWKRPWRLSSMQKSRVRQRMQTVDQNIESLAFGLESNGLTSKRVQHLMEKFPKEAEMPSKNKYTVFDKHSRGYRKGVHFVPKWTKKSLRVDPENF